MIIKKRQKTALDSVKPLPIDYASVDSRSEKKSSAKLAPHDDTWLTRLFMLSIVGTDSGIPLSLSKERVLNAL